MNERKSFRTERAASLLQSALVEVLRNGKMLDEKLLNCPLAITRVKMSADLKMADCFFIPFNTKLSVEEILQSLNKSKYAIRNQVTSKIQLKYSPEIKFHYDQGFDNVRQVEELLEKL